MNDISRFSNTADYLPIINAAILTDGIVMFMSLTGVIQSKTLKTWYKKYGFTAFLQDVLSIFIGIIIARALYYSFFKSYSLLFFLFLVCSVQICHDIVFATFINVFPRGKSNIFDLFHDYQKEEGFVILLADLAMMVSTVLIASGVFSNLSFNTNFVFFIVFLYLIPYLIGSF